MASLSGTGSGKNRVGERRTSNIWWGGGINLRIIQRTDGNGNLIFQEYAEAELTIPAGVFILGENDIDLSDFSELATTFNCSANRAMSITGSNAMIEGIRFTGGNSGEARGRFPKSLFPSGKSCSVKMSLAGQRSDIKIKNQINRGTPQWFNMVG